MYSESLLHRFRSRPHAGRLDSITDAGVGGAPGGGPFIRLWLRIDAGVVTAACYKTYGCPAAIACSEALCELVEGRATAEIGVVTPEEVEARVGGVPPEKSHCPVLAAEAWNSRRPVER